MAHPDNLDPLLRHYSGLHSLLFYSALPVQANLLLVGSRPDSPWNMYWPKPDYDRIIRRSHTKFYSGLVVRYPSDLYR